MSLAAGTRVGHYEIVSALGAGGMGEVYRARDTKLDRDVALKILPESFASDPDRLMRFTREARTLASLNHPNIAAIYGIEESDSGGRGVPGSSATRALVMELVEGEDLSARIGGLGTPGARRTTGLPPDEALAIARQIADALEAAHEAGIIHRDLKPANIKVRADGAVKVLDFGLAKAMDANPIGAAEATGQHSNAATMTSPAMTAMGLILGTAAYMSPEQARGKPVDKRADIWAFGVVLYEMLTGITLFAGETVSDVLAAVLRADIDFAKLPPTVPPAIRHLLSRCLEKDPRRRLRDIGEARVLLESPSAHDPVATLSRRPARPMLPWAIAAALVIALGTWLTIARPWTTVTPGVRLRASMAAGFTGQLGDRLQPALVLSPDGSTMAFAVGESHQNRDTGLYVRRLDELAATRLEGTDGASGPFFSPTGEWLAYFARGKLLKVPVRGGASVPLADAAMARGGAWGSDDVITYAPVAAPGGTLMRVPAGGGTPAPLGVMLDGHATQRWPQALPGNRAILYTGAPTVDNFDDACLVAQTLDGAPPRLLQCGGSSWRYLQSGHVLYVHSGTLFAAPFDLGTLAITGTGVPVLEDVESAVVSGAAQFSVTDAGMLAYLSGDGLGSEAPINVVDRQGNSTTLAGAPVNWRSLAYSPSGLQLAIDTSTTSARNIWVRDLARDSPQRFTFGTVADSYPVWTFEGTRLTFASAPGGPPNIFWQPIDGGPPERLVQSPLVLIPGSWSPDGRQHAFTQIRDGQGDVMVLPMEGDARTGLKPGTPVALFATSARESNPAFSHDGKWLAYVSNESTVLQVYVASVADPTRRWQVSIDGGNQPMWSRTSPELLFRTEEVGSQIFFVTYDTPGDTFRPSRPALWTPARFTLRSGTNDVALHPDGRHIAGLLASTAAAPRVEPTVVLMTDFFAVLKGKVPVR